MKDNIDEKLKLYKTAYSPLYEKYVGIKSVHYDSDGKAILTCRLEGKNEDVLFRSYELTNFCL